MSRMRSLAVIFNYTTSVLTAIFIILSTWLIITQLSMVRTTQVQRHTRSPKLIMLESGLLTVLVSSM